jgi:hypothetical protein
VRSRDSSYGTATGYTLDCRGSIPGRCKRYFFFFFFNRIVGGGVQLGPLGTAATDWPIVPAPGDYDDGEFG